MARKAASRTPAPGKKRYRRTDDELIADLKEQIAQLKARADAKKLKQSPSVKRTLTVVRTLDKALLEARDEKRGDLVEALETAREPLVEFLDGQGVKLPKPRRARTRRARQS